MIIVLTQSVPGVSTSENNYSYIKIYLVVTYIADTESETQLIGSVAVFLRDQAVGHNKVCKQI